jgi:hypothetical protein
MQHPNFLRSNVINGLRAELSPITSIMNANKEFCSTREMTVTCAGPQLRPSVNGTGISLGRAKTVLTAANSTKGPCR